MKTLCLLTLSLVSSAAFAAQYDLYINPRFDYAIEYPSNLIMQPAPTNDDGREFDSADGKVKLVVYGSYSPMVFNQTLNDLFEAALTADPTQKITYKELGKNSFVVSGTQAGKIFYTKTMDVSGTEKTFTITYDESLKGEMAPVVAKIERSFKSTAP